MKIIICALLFFILSNGVFAQIIFSGKIVSSHDQPVPGANVVLVKPNQSGILAYTISDNDGSYRIIYYENPDSVNIKVSAIGFVDVIKPLAQQSPVINFTLVEKATELPEVKVKSNPIKVSGDTADYNVSSFSTQQDRVIGDVIAKLPGIEIDPSGTIKYNGKAISNYYINGLDLLENRYGIANNNIPFDLVDKVQLLDNHQPIKVLDTLKSSTTPALNVQLKKNGMKQFIGAAKAGVGLSPALSDDAITGMQFNKSFQFISAYKYNNTGLRLSNELTQQFYIHDINEPARENVSENLLSLISLPAPLLQEARYLFNNNHLFHLSAIKVLKNTVQVKFNVGFLNDYNKIEGSNATTLFLPSDTIKFIENQKTGISTNKLNGDFYYTLNKKNKYIKNASKMQLEFDNEKGRVNNSQSIYQNLNNPFYQFENNFLMLTPIKRKLISFKSYTILNRTPQTLSVNPGQFSEIINQSLPYDRLAQNAVLNKFTSDNSLSFITKVHQLEQEFNVGSEYIYKQLSTSLFKENNHHIYALNDSFQNELSWQNMRLYANANTIIKFGKKQISISLPVELNSVSITNKINNSKDKKSYFFFNPNVNAVLPYSSFFSTEVAYSHRNSIGNFIQTTPGFILTNYRSISQNDTLLPVQRIDNISVGNSYKNPLAGLFANVSLSYSNFKYNIIYDQLYNGIFLKQTAIVFPNTTKNIVLSGRVNKYFFESKTSITLSYNYIWQKQLQIQQNDFVNIYTRGNVLNAKINWDKFTFISLGSNSILKIFTNSNKPLSKKESNFSAFQFQQNLKVSFFLSNKATIYLNSEYYNFWDKKLSLNSFYFGDAGIKLTYHKIDVELACNNLTNNKSFIAQSISNNFKQITQTEIRRRTLILKCYFKF